MGLVTLRYGPAEGVLVLLGSAFVTGAFTLLLLGSPHTVLLFTLGSWVPVWLLAAVLWYSASQGAALTAACLLGALLVAGIHLVLPDPAGWWQDWLSRMVTQTVRNSDLALGQAEQENLTTNLAAVASIMTGLVVAVTIFGAVITLFLARWWHALLDNPGGFGKEFRNLKIYRWVGYAAVVLILLVLITHRTGGELSLDLLWSVMVVYMFQGLALAHNAAFQQGLSRGWLIALYILLVIPYSSLFAILALAITGLADTWFDFRGKLNAAG
jgi:hypothetical protein